MPDRRALIEAAYADRSRLDARAAEAVHETIADLDAGRVRVAEPVDDVEGSAWRVHAWIKEAILLYFGLAKMQVLEVGPFEYHDKIPLKRGLAEAGVRVVAYDRYPGVLQRLQDFGGVVG